MYSDLASDSILLTIGFTFAFFRHVRSTKICPMSRPHKRLSLNSCTRQLRHKMPPKRRQRLRFVCRRVNICGTRRRSSDRNCRRPECDCRSHRNHRPQSKRPLQRRNGKHRCQLSGHRGKRMRPLCRRPAMSLSPPRWPTIRPRIHLARTKRPMLGRLRMQLLAN